MSFISGKRSVSLCHRWRSRDSTRQEKGSSACCHAAQRQEMFPCSHRLCGWWPWGCTTSHVQPAHSDCTFWWRETPNTQEKCKQPDLRGAIPKGWRNTDYPMVLQLWAVVSCLSSCSSGHPGIRDIGVSHLVSPLSTLVKKNMPKMWVPGARGDR